MRTLAIALLSLLSPSALLADGRYLEVTYAPSTRPGELQLGVTYKLWLPDGVKHLRGVIVHQHGCGAGACKGGATASEDRHWQALARKWDFALLGPSYQQNDKQNCRLWCDPRNGSEATFLRALDDFARQSHHPELKHVPWCLWGHSGGAFWASLMQTRHPDRIVALWFRSGTAYASWEKGEIPRPEIPPTAYAIPTMCNPGAKEKGDARFNGAWTGSLAMFQAYRAKGAFIGFAPDPRTSHECGDSRYLAIPFFDVCLEQRLPPPGTEAKLRPMSTDKACLAPLLGDEAVPVAKFQGKSSEAVWLPNETLALAWAEYVKTGAVSDRTPPPAPKSVQLRSLPDGSVEITWDAHADLESGIREFVIQRDGQDLAKLPEKPLGRFGRPLFQTMSYHDTPEAPVPAMRYVDRTAMQGAKHDYRVITINSVGLRSTAARP